MAASFILEAPKMRGSFQLSILYKAEKKKGKEIWLEMTKKI